MIEFWSLLLSFLWRVTFSKLPYQKGHILGRQLSNGIKVDRTLLKEMFHYVSRLA